MNGNSKLIGMLIEKYFEGLTSSKEEQTLRNYFQQKNIPDEWKIYQPLFCFFADERKKRLTKQPAFYLYRRISIFAAACLFLLFGLKFIFKTHSTFLETSQVYINGKKHTNIELIHSEALKALENLSENTDDIFSCQIEALNLFFNNK